VEYILERQPAKLDLLLLNPQHVKALPGHKTDLVDAARIAELTQYGLVRASFVPPEEIRELRDLVRRPWNSLPRSPTWPNKPAASLSALRHR
jgi:hypothetical protein